MGDSPPTSTAWLLAYQAPTPTLLMLNAAGIGLSVWKVARKRFGFGGSILVTAGAFAAFLVFKQLLRSRNPEAADRLEQLS